ncbi:hypothetical protein DPMN_067467 [Dreissena polymorpha]|uniref:Uncharacterized protein n=1 Tax=Dreissena polymorpha TaxID=45954 RepID=A0A9D3YVU6_DREPO|nr:hypothetical protein DPMN_067467 [Dreissena polymorpha]
MRRIVATSVRSIPVIRSCLLNALICWVSLSVFPSSFTTCLYMLGIALCIDLFFHNVSVCAWYRSLSLPLLSPRVCICLVSLSVSTSSLTTCLHMLGIALCLDLFFTTCLYMLGIALCLDLLFHHVSVYAWYRSLSRPPLSPRVCICLVSLSVSTFSFTTCLYMLGIGLCLDLLFHHVPVLCREC